MVKKRSMAMNKKKIAVLTIMVGVMSYAAYQTGKSKTGL